MSTRDETGHITTTSSNPMTLTPGTAGKFLYTRGNTSFEIDAEVEKTNPFVIVFTDPGSKALAGGYRKVHRVLRTTKQRERFRPLRVGEQPAPLPDPEQRLRDAAWQGEIDGLTTSQIAAQFDLARQRASGVLTHILQGKSSDPRFGKPTGSNYHDKRALISGDRILTRERVSGLQNEYRWLVVMEQPG